MVKVNDWETPYIPPEGAIGPTRPAVVDVRPLSTLSPGERFAALPDASGLSGGYWRPAIRGGLVGKGRCDCAFRAGWEWGRLGGRKPHVVRVGAVPLSTLWGANYYLTPRSRVELEFAPHRLQQPAPDRARLRATGGPAAATEPRGRGNDRSVEARRGRLEFFVRRTASCEILRGRFPPAPIPEIPTLRTGTSYRAGMPSSFSTDAALDAIGRDVPSTGRREGLKTFVSP